jgi:cytochrome b561
MLFSTREKKSLHICSHDIPRETKMAPTTSKFSLPTRLFHAGLASAIVLQLASSQLMQVPRGDRAANWAFQVHSYSGMAALGLALLLWAVVMTRIGGTDAGALVPWFSATRRAALFADIKAHWADLKKRQLPAYNEQSPFASAIHGLGLLLMTAMATTGTIYFIAGQIGLGDNALLHLLMDAHGAGGSLVWIYLIGHAGLATIHHFKNDMSLREMWSIRASK